MGHKFPVLTVKKWLKSIYIYGSYRKNKIGVPFFWTTLYSRPPQPHTDMVTFGTQNKKLSYHRENSSTSAKHYSAAQLLFVKVTTLI